MIKSKPWTACIENNHEPNICIDFEVCYITLLITVCFLIVECFVSLDLNENWSSSFTNCSTGLVHIKKTEFPTIFASSLYSDLW